jgi:hypothetical protein
MRLPHIDISEVSNENHFVFHRNVPQKSQLNQSLLKPIKYEVATFAQPIQRAAAVGEPPLLP